MDAMGIAASGMNVYSTWMDMTANNVANLDTVRATGGPAFQAAQPVVGTGPGGAGAVVAGITYTSPQGTPQYDPTQPMADASGYVLAPATDLVDQTSQMIVAQMGYEANVANFARAKDAYKSLLDL